MEGDKVVVLCNPDCGLPSIQPQSVIQIEMHRKCENMESQERNGM
jgi:hypothetical protein